LAAHQISIEAILQKEPRGEDEATVALITNVVREGDFNAALAEIRALPFVRDSHSHLRVEPFAG
jgi:homoserine dehydrogenase